MNIELVAIGNEVLNGFTVNTNAAFIGQQLLQQGFSLRRQTILPDSEAAIFEGLKEALERSDVVIATGGLGPTLDDVTRKAAASLFDSSFRFDPVVAYDLERRFGKDFPTLRDQATVPEKAHVLLNFIGTAPGFIFEMQGKSLLMLPGVPEEMQAMCIKDVLPYLMRRGSHAHRVYKKAIHLMELPEHAVDPTLREFRTRYPDVDFGIYPSLGTLTLHLSAEAADERSALALLERPFAELKQHFAAHSFASPTGTLEEAVHQVFMEQSWTLSAAESCTGGAVAARMTRLPGASHYFLGSVVAYANEIKRDVLHVPAAVIDAYGAVSQETAVKMLEGILQLTGSDFGLAVTGIAGPSGGTSEKPVGTVWCAVSRTGVPPYVWKLQGSGTREMIIKRSVNSLLAHLLIYIKGLCNNKLQNP